MKKLLFCLVLLLNNSWAFEAVEPKQVIIWEEKDCLVKGNKEEENSICYDCKCYDYSYSYDKSGIEFIDKILLGGKNEEEVKKEFLNGIKEEKEFLQEIETSGASNIIENKFLGQRGRFVQYVSHTYTYNAGAAHSIYGDSYYVFDLSKNKQISLEDILIEGKNEDLEKLLEKKLADNFLSGEAGYGDLENTEDYKKCLNKEKTNMTECANKVLLFEAHPFTDGNIYKTADNFYFDRYGINFNFPPYSIAPYALGSLEAKIDWKDLKGIIKDEYLP